MPKLRSYRSADGTLWGVDVDLPGSSNAIVRFRHPNGRTARLDRYNWFLSHGPEARSVTARLSRDKVLESLSGDDIEQLFKRSMPISRPDPLIPSSAASNG
jgi:hypothetical protein